MKRVFLIIMCLLLFVSIVTAEETSYKIVLEVNGVLHTEMLYPIHDTWRPWGYINLVNWSRETEYTIRAIVGYPKSVYGVALTYTDFIWSDLSELFTFIVTDKDLYLAMITNPSPSKPINLQTVK